MNHKSIENARDDFPLLQQTMHAKPLVFLDSGASTQKPQVVIDALTNYYTRQNANIHRGIYQLSQQATQAFEQVREKVANFINAPQLHEVIFTHGATEAINLVAHGFAASQLEKDDEIIISGMEHHANIVPWQIACEKTGAKLRIIPVLDDGCLDLTAYADLFNGHTKLIALTHVSNVLGTINPIKSMIATAHANGVPVLIDGAQGVPHQKVDVQDLDCDFYVISGHKMYAPTGIGVLYGKTQWLETLPPYQAGGSMITQVTFEKTEYAPLPLKFEAGTPHIAGVIGLGAAIDYLQAFGMGQITAYEKQLVDYATTAFNNFPGLRLLGTAKDRAGVFSFVLEDVHAHDIATILDDQGIAVRAGHHCAMPLMQRFAVPAVVRASLGLYSKRADIDALMLGLEKARVLFEA